jgi:histidine kinase
MLHPPDEPKVRRGVIQGALKSFRDISLKNKIFYSFLAVILIISAIIAFLARWILVSTLISELELRGIVIARTIAERSSGFILDKNYPELLSLIFEEAKLKERQNLVSYIFVSDRDDQVLSHTLTRRFPESLRLANRVPANESKSVQLCQFGNQTAYDIAIPIVQGIYRIGTVHVGLNKHHIDQLVAKLRFTFLSFLSMVIVIIFVISHWLAKYITLPISRLTRISDELSKGNFEVRLETEPFTDGDPPSECPAFVNTDMPCWHLDGMALTDDDGTESLAICKDCRFYRGQKGDEVVQLANSFYNMIWSIRLYRRRLRESEKKYRSLFDSGPDPIFVVSSRTSEIIDANPRAEEVYGYSKAELIGKSFIDMGLEHTPGFFQSLQEKTDTDELVNFPKTLHFKNGRKPFYVNLHACNITYKGQPAIVVASTDITEMIEKDAQLIQASKMKSLGEMSAGIAHELNQPLNAIKMGSDFLGMMVDLGREIPPDHLREVVSEMSTQVDRAAEIINTLRAFGRKAELVMERLDINKPIRAVFTRWFVSSNWTISAWICNWLRPLHRFWLMTTGFSRFSSIWSPMPEMPLPKKKSRCPIRMRAGLLSAPGRKATGPWRKWKTTASALPTVCGIKFSSRFSAPRKAAMTWGWGWLLHTESSRIMGEKSRWSVMKGRVPCSGFGFRRSGVWMTDLPYVGKDRITVVPPSFSLSLWFLIFNSY